MADGVDRTASLLGIAVPLGHDSFPLQNGTVNYWRKKMNIRLRFAMGRSRGLAARQFHAEKLSRPLHPPTPTSASFRRNKEMFMRRRTDREEGREGQNMLNRRQL